MLRSAPFILFMMLLRHATAHAAFAAAMHAMLRHERRTYAMRITTMPRAQCYDMPRHATLLFMPISPL